MACFPACPLLDGFDASNSLPDDVTLESLLLGESPDDLCGEGLTGPSRVLLCSSRVSFLALEAAGGARLGGGDAVAGSCCALDESESGEEDCAARGAWTAAFGGAVGAVAGSSPPPLSPPLPRGTQGSQGVGAPFALGGAPSGLTRAGAPIAAHSRYTNGEYDGSARATASGASEPLPLLYPLASSPPPARPYDGFQPPPVRAGAAGGDPFRAPSGGRDARGFVSLGAPDAGTLTGPDMGTHVGPCVPALDGPPAAAWLAPADPSRARPFPEPAYGVCAPGEPPLPCPPAPLAYPPAPPRAAHPAAACAACPPAPDAHPLEPAFAHPAPALAEALSPRESAVQCAPFVATPSCASAPPRSCGFDASSPTFSSAPVPHPPPAHLHPALALAGAPPPPPAPAASGGASPAAAGFVPLAPPLPPLAPFAPCDSGSPSPPSSHSQPALPPLAFPSGALPGLSVRVRAPGSFSAAALAHDASAALGSPSSATAETARSQRRSSARARAAREGGAQADRCALPAHGGVAPARAPARRRRRRGANGAPPLAPDVMEAALRISAPVVSGVSGGAAAARAAAVASAAAAGGVFSLARVVTSGGQRSCTRPSAAEGCDSSARRHLHPSLAAASASASVSAAARSGFPIGSALDSGAAAAVSSCNPSASVSSGGLCSGSGSGSGRSSGGPSPLSPLSAPEGYASAPAAPDGWAPAACGASSPRLGDGGGGDPAASAVAAAFARPATPITPASCSSSLPRPSTDSAGTAFAHPAGASPLSPTSCISAGGAGADGVAELGSGTPGSASRLVLVDPAVASALMLRLRTPSQRDAA